MAKLSRLMVNLQGEEIELGMGTIGVLEQAFPDYANYKTIIINNPFSYTVTENGWIQIGFNSYTNQVVVINNSRTASSQRVVLPVSVGDVVTCEGVPSFANFIPMKINYDGGVLPIKSSEVALVPDYSTPLTVEQEWSGTAPNLTINWTVTHDCFISIHAGAGSDVECRINGLIYERIGGEGSTVQTAYTLVKAGWIISGNASVAGSGLRSLPIRAVSVNIGR